RKAHQPLRDSDFLPLFCRQCTMRSVERKACQRFHPAQTRRRYCYLKPLQQSESHLVSSCHLEGQHAAVTVAAVCIDSSPRILSSRWMKDLLHFGVRFQVASERLCVTRLALHSNLKGLQSTLQHVASMGIQGATGTEHLRPDAINILAG